MARLRKSDVEVLLAAIDSPLLLAAVAQALRRILEVDGFEDDWPALVALAARVDGWTDGRRWALLAEDDRALAELAVELNERRDLGPDAPPR
jgi:hypothetical protein